MESMFSVCSKRLRVVLNVAGICGFLAAAALMSCKAFMVAGRDYVNPADVDELQRLAVLGMAFIAFRWVVDALGHSGFLRWAERDWVRRRGQS